MEQPLLESIQDQHPLSELCPSHHQTISSSKFEEMYLLTKIALPIFLSVFCEWMPELISFIMIGHSVDCITNLTIIGLSYTFYNFILFIVWGLLSGLYTLIQDIYQKQYEHISTTNYYIRLYSQRAFIITLIISIPFVILLSYSGTILVSFGINSSLELDINFVCMQLIATLYIELWKSITQRIAESLAEREDTNKYLFFCNICTAILSFPISWYFIFYLDLAFKAFAIIITLCSFINLILIILLLNCKNYGYIFQPLSINKLLNFKGVGQYLQLSLPGMVISLFEISTSYLIILLCGFINIENINNKIAVSCAIIINLIMRFLQFIFTAISYSISIRIDGYIYMECVGIYNNKQMISKAKETKDIGYIIILIVIAIISLILYFLKRQILYIFINNDQVIDLCFILMDILIIHSFIMSFEYLLSGIFRGVGQSYCANPAKIILCSYYIIPFPVMLILLFVYRYNQSLYYGTMILFSLFAFSKLISVIVMQIIFWCKIDWNKVSTDKYKTNLMQLQIDEV